MPTYRLAIKPWIPIKCLHTGWAKQTCTKTFCAQQFMYPKSLWRASSKRQYICHLEEALYKTIKNIWSLWNDPWFSWKTHFIEEKHEALHSDWSPGITKKSFKNSVFCSVFNIFSVKNAVIYTFVRLKVGPKHLFLQCFQCSGIQKPFNISLFTVFFHFCPFFPCRKPTKMTQNSVSIPS